MASGAQHSGNCECFQGSGRRPVHPSAPGQRGSGLEVGEPFSAQGPAPMDGLIFGILL